MPDWGSIFGAIGEGARGYQSFQTLGPQWREIQAEQERKRQADAQQEQDRQAAAAQNLTTSRNADERAATASREQSLNNRGLRRDRALKGFGGAYAGFLAEQDNAREAGPLPPEREPQAPGVGNFLDDPNDPEMGAWLGEMGPRTGRLLYDESKGVRARESQAAQLERDKIKAMTTASEGERNRAARLEGILLGQAGQDRRSDASLNFRRDQQDAKEATDFFDRIAKVDGAQRALTIAESQIRARLKDDPARAQTLVDQLREHAVQYPSGSATMNGQVFGAANPSAPRASGATGGPPEPSVSPSPAQGATPPAGNDPPLPPPGAMATAQPGYYNHPTRGRVYWNGTSLR